MANGTTSSSRIKYSIVATLIYLRLLSVGRRFLHEKVAAHGGALSGLKRERVRSDLPVRGLNSLPAGLPPTLSDADFGTSAESLAGRLVSGRPLRVTTLGRFLGSVCRAH